MLRGSISREPGMNPESPLISNGLGRENNDCLLAKGLSWLSSGPGDSWQGRPPIAGQ